PFDATDDRAPTSRSRPDSISPPSRLVPELSASLDRIVRRCLAKLPSDRYASAHELSRALSSELAPDGATPTTGVVAAELARLGLVANTASRQEALRPSLLRRKPATVGTALTGYLVALLLIVLGGAAIEGGPLARRSDRSRTGGSQLVLVPPRAG